MLTEPSKWGIWCVVVMVVVVVLLLWSWRPHLSTSINVCIHPSIRTDRQTWHVFHYIHVTYTYLKSINTCIQYITVVHYSIIIVHYITLQHSAYIHPTSSHPRNHSQTSNIFTFSGVPGRFSWTTCGLPCIECLETDGKNDSFSLCHFDVTSRLWDVSLLLLDVEGHALVFIWQQHHY